MIKQDKVQVQSLFEWSEHVIKNPFWIRVLGVPVAIGVDEIKLPNGEVAEKPKEQIVVDELKKMSKSARKPWFKGVKMTLAEKLQAKKQA